MIIEVPHSCNVHFEMNETCLKNDLECFEALKFHGKSLG